MRIGITYDVLSDYGFQKTDLIFADFTSETTVSYIKRALEFLGHQVELIGNLPKLMRLVHTNQLNCDLVFNIAEGISSRNREGLIPAFLECHKIPYTGSDAYALTLTLNKMHTKLVAQYLGVRTPAFSYIPYLTPSSLFSDMLSHLCYPIVIKPNQEGSSMGVYVARYEQECINGILRNFENYKQGVLCEEYVDGLEVTVPIVGTMEESKVLGISSFTHSNVGELSDIHIYTKEMKYFDDTIPFVPELPHAVREEINTGSLRIHRHLQCNDYNRIDYKISSQQVPYLLEVNPLPSLAPEGSFETCANHLGMKYHDVINQIVTSAQRRYGLRVAQ